MAHAKITNFSTPEDEDAVVVNCPMMISALLDGSTIDCQPNKYFLMAKKKKKFLYRHIVYMVYMTNHEMKVEKIGLSY